MYIKCFNCALTNSQDHNYFSVSYNEEPSWINTTDIELCEDCLIEWCSENLSKIITIYRILDPIDV